MRGKKASSKRCLHLAASKQLEKNIDQSGSESFYCIFAWDIMWAWPGAVAPPGQEGSRLRGAVAADRHTDRPQDASMWWELPCFVLGMWPCSVRMGGVGAQCHPEAGTGKQQR